MRKIRFDYLIIENFKAITEAVAIHLEKFEPGCHAVRGVNEAFPRLGSNGASKSSIWDALTFALYGRTPRGVRGSSLVPRGTKLNPVVTLGFWVEDADYTITRTAHPHQLAINGQVVEQAYLDELFGVPYKVFIRTVCLAQNQPLFLDLRPADKLTLISEVLELDRFDTWSQTAATEAAKAGNTMAGLSICQATAVGKIQATTDQLAHLNEKLATHRETREAEIKALTGEQNVLQIELLAITAKGSDAAARMEPLKLKTENLEQLLIAANVALQSAIVQHAEQKHLAEHANFLAGKAKSCPSCGQTIKAEFRAAELKRVRKVLSTLPNLQDFHNGRNAAAAAHAKVEKEYHAVQREYWDVMGKVQIATSKRDNGIDRLERARALSDPYSTDISVAKTKLKSFNAELGVIGGNLEHATILRDRYAVWQSGFKAIKLMIVDGIMETLSLLTTSYASQLGLEVQAQFSVEREAKTGTTVRGINLTVDDVYDFNTWSGGEGQRLRLAASLALAAVLLGEIGVEIPIRILDEPSASLSPEGLRELAGFLVLHGENEKLAIFLTDQRPVTGVTSTLTVTRHTTGVEITHGG